MSESDIKARIEKTLSDILSDKYDVIVKLKFVKMEETNQNGSTNES